MEYLVACKEEITSNTVLALGDEPGKVYRSPIDEILVVVGGGGWGDFSVLFFFSILPSLYF